MRDSLQSIWAVILLIFLTGIAIGVAYAPEIRVKLGQAAPPTEESGPVWYGDNMPTEVPKELRVRKLPGPAVAEDVPPERIIPSEPDPNDVQFVAPYLSDNNGNRM